MSRNNAKTATFNPLDYPVGEICEAPGFARKQGVEKFFYAPWPVPTAPWITTVVVYQGWFGVLLDDHDEAFAKETAALIEEGYLIANRDYLRLPVRAAKVISRLCHPEGGLQGRTPHAPRVLLTFQGRARALLRLDVTLLVMPVERGLLSASIPVAEA